MKKFLVPLALTFAFGCLNQSPSSVASVNSAFALNTAAPSFVYKLASDSAGYEMDGITGDKVLLFTTRTQHATPSPAPDVLAFLRFGSAPLGSVAAPSGGWVGPTGVEVLDYTSTNGGTCGHLLVWDNNALPPTPSIRVVKVAYSWSQSTGFSSSVDTIYSLPLQSAAPPTINGLGFLSDVMTLPDGGHILNDPFIGDLWACDASFNCALAMVDPDFAPAPSPTFTGYGRAPGGGTRAYTLDLSVGLSPGVVGAAYMTVTDEVCVGRTAQPGGIWCIDRATLENTSLSPFGKLKRAVVPPTLGVSDGGHGLSADKNHPSSPYLYWIRSYSDSAGGNLNRAFRIDVVSGNAQVIAATNTLLDFGTGISVLPNEFPGSPLVNVAISMGQEENNGLLNTDLGGADNFVAPTFITGVTLSMF
jgi:hypothetical protein